MTKFFWPVDGVIVVVYIVASLVIGLSVRKFVRNAKDFIAAGQSVNLYAGLASLAATEFGIITAMGQSQLGYRYGFSGITLGILFALTMIFLGRTGFCIGQLRDSNVLTLPDFFELKFNAGVRRLSAIVMFFAGVLNMGLFLRTGGDFLVITMGLPPRFLEITMTILLIIVLIYVVLGGLLSVLVTDFVQFLLMSSVMIGITLFVIFNVGWGNMMSTVASKYGYGGFNPFVNPQLGMNFVLFTFLTVLSTSLTFQPVISRVLASKDTSIAKGLYKNMGLFQLVRSTIPVVWGIGALTLVAAGRFEVKAPIMAMPTMMALILPMGLIGLFIAGMLAADMSTMSSYLLAWSGILWNDILIVFHKNKWDDRKAVAINRLLVVAIGVFLLFYGLWYPLKGDLWTYLALVARISAVSGTIIFISGCYWNKASVVGAYLCIILGAIPPAAYLVAEQTPALLEAAKKIGPYTSGNMAFVFAAAGMLVGSYLFPNKTVKNA